MKIVIKEMLKDRNKLLLYLMTNDDIPVKCVMTTRAKAKEVIDTLTPNGSKDIITITYKTPEYILEDE